MGREQIKYKLVFFEPNSTSWTTAISDLSFEAAREEYYDRTERSMDDGYEYAILDDNDYRINIPVKVSKFDRFYNQEYE